MADLTQRLDTAAQALDAFDALLPAGDRSEVERDAAIHRFVIAFEAVFAAVRHHLREAELEERSSPGACIRASRAAGLIDAPVAETLIALTKDRNLAVHTYNEDMARALAARLPDHARLLRRWFDGLKVAAGRP
jgi:uncharacterized protein YutE (UPF0331/DUF86 family)